MAPASTLLPIRTERLVLRPLEERDLDDIYVYHSSAEAVRYMYWVPRDRDETREALEKKRLMVHLDEDGSALVLAIEHDDTVIGELILRCLSKKHRQGEIGFVLNPAYHGYGYAAEGATALLDRAFSVYEFHRVVGRCDARNASSYRLMERLGMRREAHFIDNEIFKGEWGSELVYAILASEWAARTHARPPRPGPVAD